MPKMCAFLLAVAALLGSFRGAAAHKAPRQQASSYPPYPSSLSRVAPPRVTPTPPPMGPAKPSPIQAGIAADCNSWHLVKSGDTCGGLVSTYGNFTLQQFYTWNPAVGNTCQLLFLDYWVCIGVATPISTTTTTTSIPPTTTPVIPSPTQPGVTPSCKKWHHVVSGDFCLLIAYMYSITLDDFYKWNPSVGNTCQSLYLGYYVCVGV